MKKFDKAIIGIVFTTMAIPSSMIAAQKIQKISIEQNSIQAKNKKDKNNNFLDDMIGFSAFRGAEPNIIRLGDGWEYGDDDTLYLTDYTNDMHNDAPWLHDDATDTKYYPKKVVFKNKITPIGKFNIGQHGTTFNVEEFVNFKNLDLSKVTDMSYSFFTTNKTKTFDIGLLDTSHVTNMDHMFYGSTINNHTINDMNVSSAENMTSMFNLANIANLDLSKWNTSKLKIMDSMFYASYMYDIKGIEKLDTSNVTSMISTFGYSALQSLNLKGWNTSNVTDMRGMFDKSHYLKEITFGDNFKVPTDETKRPSMPNQTDTMKWREIGTGTKDKPNGEFLNESANEPFVLNEQPKAGTYVLAPYKVSKTLNMWKENADSNSAINKGTYGENGLTNYIYKADPFKDQVSEDDLNTADNKEEVIAKGRYGNVADMSVKWYINQAGELHISQGAVGMHYINPDNPQDQQSSPWVRFNNDIKKVIFDGTVTLDQQAPQGMFGNLTNVTEYVGLDKVKLSGATSIISMFMNNKSLTKIDLSSWDTSNISIMGLVFSGDEKLTDINVSNWDVRKAGTANGMFSNVAATSIDLSGWNPMNLHTLSAMFQNAKNLNHIEYGPEWKANAFIYMTDMFNGTAFSELDLSTWKTPQLNNLANAFANMRNLTSFKISPDFTTDKVEYFNGAFSGDSKLKTLDINTWDTSKALFMSSMFQSMSSLTDLTLGENFKVDNVEYFNNMFDGDTVLKQLDFSKWTNAKGTNYSSMFKDTTFKKLDLSGFDTSKANYMQEMFKGMNNLEEIKLGSSFTPASIANMNANIPNQTSSLKWREIGSGDTTKPKGDFLKKDVIGEINIDFTPKAGTYVLRPVNDKNNIIDPNNPKNTLPDKEKGTETEDVRKPDPGEISLDAVPNFEFGEHDLDYSKTKFSAKENINSNGALPHYLQLTNNLNNSSNFSLTVKDSGFTDGSNTLDSQISLKTKNIISNDENFDNSIEKPNFSINGTEQDILNMSNDKINGSLQLQFDAKDINLNILNNDLKTGEFSDTITWSLKLAD